MIEKWYRAGELIGLAAFWLSFVGAGLAIALAVGLALGVILGLLPGGVGF